MKLKSIIALAAVVIFAACSSTYRATDNGFLVSADAQRSFDSQYPSSTNVVWGAYDANLVILNDWGLTGWEELDASDYVVTFNMDGEKYYAWYNQDGTWVGTAYVVNDHTRLPVYVTSALTTQYPNHTIVSANKEFYKDRQLYEITIKDRYNKTVLLVDENGNVIKSKTKAL